MYDGRSGPKPCSGHTQLVASVCANICNFFLREIAAVLSAISFVGLAVGLAGAAEITMGETVVLEGQIEPGDYEKLRDFLVVGRDYGFNGPSCSAIYLDGCPKEIYLASPVGDLAAAIKIGRLIRALGWATNVPNRHLAKKG
jgi:hypothetical protein